MKIKKIIFDDNLNNTPFFKNIKQNIIKSQEDTKLHNTPPSSSIAPKYLALKKMPIQHPFLFNHPKLYNDPAMKQLITLIQNEFQRHMKNIAIQKDILKRILQRENILDYLNLLYEQNILDLTQEIRAHFFAQLLHSKKIQEEILKASNQKFIDFTQMLKEISLFFRDKSWEFNYTENLKTKEKQLQYAQNIQDARLQNILNNYYINLMLNIATQLAHNNNELLNSKTNHSYKLYLQKLQSALLFLLKKEKLNLASSLHDNNKNNIQNPIPITNLTQIYFQEKILNNLQKPNIKFTLHNLYNTSNNYTKTDNYFNTHPQLKVFNNNSSTTADKFKKVVIQQFSHKNTKTDDYTKSVQDSINHSWYSLIGFLNLKNFIPYEISYENPLSLSTNKDNKILDKHIENTYFTDSIFKNNFIKNLQQVDKILEISKANINNTSIVQNFSKFFLPPPTYMIPAITINNINFNKYNSMRNFDIQLASTVTSIESSIFKKVA